MFEYKKKYFLWKNHKLGYNYFQVISTSILLENFCYVKNLTCFSPGFHCTQRWYKYNQSTIYDRIRGKIKM